MKKRVLLLCGSPHAEGCTRRALREVEAALEQAGVETETFCIGAGPVRGCVACGGCGRAGRCVFADEAYDRLTAMLERRTAWWWVPRCTMPDPTAACAPCWTGCFIPPGTFSGASPPARWSTAAGEAPAPPSTGSTSTSPSAQMPVVPSVYWNSTHGCTPEEVEQDREGLQVMRALGRNMAAMLALPVLRGTGDESRVATNFIR